MNSREVNWEEEFDNKFPNTLLQKERQRICDELEGMKIRKYDALCFHFGCNLMGIAGKRDCYVEKRKAEEYNKIIDLAIWKINE